MLETRDFADAIITEQWGDLLCRHGPDDAVLLLVRRTGRPGLAIRQRILDLDLPVRCFRVLVVRRQYTFPAPQQCLRIAAHTSEEAQALARRRLPEGGATWLVAGCWRLVWTGEAWISPEARQRFTPAGRDPGPPLEGRPLEQEP